MSESKQCPECQSWDIGLYWSGVCYGTCSGCGHIWIDSEEDDGDGPEIAAALDFSKAPGWAREGEVMDIKESREEILRAVLEMFSAKPDDYPGHEYYYYLGNPIGLLCMYWTGVWSGRWIQFRTWLPEEVMSLISEETCFVLVWSREK